MATLVCTNGQSAHKSIIDKNIISTIIETYKKSRGPLCPQYNALLDHEAIFHEQLNTYLELGVEVWESVGLEIERVADLPV